MCVCERERECVCVCLLWVLTVDSVLAPQNQQVFTDALDFLDESFSSLWLLLVHRCGFLNSFYRRSIQALPTLIPKPDLCARARVCVCVCVRAQAQAC